MKLRCSAKRRFFNRSHSKQKAKQLTYGEIVRLRGKSLTDVGHDFCDNFMHELHRLRTETLCTVGEGMLVHPTRGKVGFLQSLRAMPTEWL